MRRKGCNLCKGMQLDIRRFVYPSLKTRIQEDNYMARIAGVDLPREKRVEIGLTYIFGIGRTTSGSLQKQVSIRAPASEI